MKKKALILLLAAAVSASLFAGCGNTAGPADNGSAVTTEEPDGENAAQEADGTEAPGSETSEEADAGKDTEVKDEPEDADAEEDTKAEDEPQETDAEKDTGTEPEQESVSWLEEHGITITPQGDCSVKLYGYDSYPEDYVDDFMADVNVAISETTEGVDEGLKKVTVVYTLDISNEPSNGVLWGYGTFDRDTGVYFRGGSKTKEAVKIGDEYFDVWTETDTVNEHPIYYITRTLTCPADYDGAVFLFGYRSHEMSEKNNQIDYTVRLYTVDELPFVIEDSLYSTLTDE